MCLLQPKHSILHNSPAQENKFRKTLFIQAYFFMFLSCKWPVRLLKVIAVPVARSAFRNFLFPLCSCTFKFYGSLVIYFKSYSFSRSRQRRKYSLRVWMKTFFLTLLYYCCPPYYLLIQICMKLVSIDWKKLFVQLGVY